MPQPLPKGLGTPILALFPRSSIPLPEIHTNSTGAPCVTSTGLTFPFLIFCYRNNIRESKDWISIPSRHLMAHCDFSRYVVHLYVLRAVTRRRRIPAKSVIKHVVSVRWVYTGFWRLLRAGINANFDVMETPSIADRTIPAWKPRLVLHAQPCTRHEPNRSLVSMCSTS